MHMTDRGRDADVDRKKTEDPEGNVDRGAARRPADSSKDMREVNENIRKSQGDDAGIRPTIDRHR